MPLTAETTCARILLVDDHPFFRMGVRQFLSGHDGFAVCGEAGTLADATRLCDEYLPDLVILDLKLPDGDGMDFLQESRGWSKPPKVLILTMRKTDDPTAVDAMRMGAAGFICKEAVAEEVLGAVRQICSGKSYLSPELIARLMRRRH